MDVRRLNRVVWLGGLLWLSGCGGLWGQIASDMVRSVERGTAGVIGDPQVEGPELWVGGAAHSRPLATDATGWRVALTDGRRVAIWDAAERRFEQILPQSGHIVVGAVFSPQGDMLVLEEEASGRAPGMARLRLVDLERGRTLSTMELPCGCLVDFVVDERGEVIRALLSGEAIGGTWVMSWSVEGELLGRREIVGDALKAGQEVSFLDRGDRVLLLRPGDGQEEVRVVDLRSVEGARRRWAIDSEASRRGCDGLMMQCIRAVHVEGDRLMIATGRPEGGAQIEIFRLGEREPESSMGLSEALPLTWMRTRGREVGLLVQWPSEQLGEVSWGIKGVDPVAGQIKEGFEALRMPVAPLMRFPGGWFAARAASPFRGAFGLPGVLDVNHWRWYRGRVRFSVDPRTGSSVIGSPYSEWIVREGGEPELLAPVDFLRAMGALEGARRSGSGRGSVWVVTDKRAVLMAAQEPGPPAPGWGQAPLMVVDELTRWEPALRTRIRAYAPLADGRLVFLVKVRHDLARLVVLEPGRGGPRHEVIADRHFPVPAHGRKWRLVLNKAGDEGAVLTTTLKSGGARVHVQRFEMASLEMGASEVIDFIGAPVDVVVTSGVGGAVVYTRSKATEISLWGAREGLAFWSPPSWGHIKNAVPVDEGIVALSLIGPWRGSEEHWFVMDLRAPGEPRVIGHRRFSQVVEAQAWSRGGRLLVLEERGVLTALDVDRVEGLRVRKRTYLHPEGRFFISVDDEGVVRMPKGGLRRGEAMEWLSRRYIMPVRLDGRGHRKME